MTKLVRATGNTIAIPRLETETLLSTLQNLYSVVMSGEEYNKDQVKAATSLANTMVKVARFQFDVYKHSLDRVITTPAEDPTFRKVP